MLTAYVDRRSDIKDSLVLGVFGSCGRNIVFYLVDLLLLNIAVEQQRSVVLVVVSNR